ncbi:MAG: S8/S53 family peptidase, partial [Bacteroidales bacterium]|nr:S8/S53 family peptidase [Bacteroidales bacterium]
MHIIQYVEKIPSICKLYTPNDYKIIDSLNNIPNYALDLINAEGAWDYTHGDSSIFIGLSDDGYLITHEDLKNKIHEVIGNPPVSTHGTFDAVLAAGETDNNIGISSIGFDCKLILGKMNYGEILELSNAGAKVVNCSWKTCGESETDKRIIHLCYDNGTLVVAGAGNGPGIQSCPPDGNGYCYPASYDQVISVSSVGPDNSHVNPWSGSIHTHNDKVNVCAPGYRIISASAVTDTSYTVSSGTSHSSPITAGLAALIYSVLPCLNPDEVKHIIEKTAYNIDTINPAYAGLLGAGRIDAEKAVSYISLFPDSADYVIESGIDTIWSGVRSVRMYIRIESGGKLTIKDDVYFNEQAKLIIEPGGELIVDGGYLTSGYCQGMWKGIELRGNRNLSQGQAGAQGIVELKNGAVVKNAYVGISVIERDTSGKLQFDKTGGIVKANNAKFINNKIGVEFYTYENHEIDDTNKIIDNLSFFKDVKFETNSSLKDTNFYPEAFVKLYDVSGIDFWGCQFVNSTPLFYEDYPDYYMTIKKGIGIFSFNSSFVVDDYEQDTISSYFDRLYYGIKAINYNPQRTFVINNAFFNQIGRAIYVGGIDNVTITSNLFKLYYNLIGGGVISDTSYCLYL